MFKTLVYLFPDTPRMRQTRKIDVEARADILEVHAAGC
jgi:hypothetical protein